MAGIPITSHPEGRTACRTKFPLLEIGLIFIMNTASLDDTVVGNNFITRRVPL